MNLREQLNKPQLHLTSYQFITLLNLFQEWALEIMGTNEHSADCASNNEPTSPAEPCNCSYQIARQEFKKNIKEATK